MELILNEESRTAEALRSASLEVLLVDTVFLRTLSLVVAVDRTPSIHLAEDLGQLPLVADSSKFVDSPKHNGWKVAVDLVVHDVTRDLTLGKCTVFIRAS